MPVNLEAEAMDMAEFDGIPDMPVSPLARASQPADVLASDAAEDFSDDESSTAPADAVDAPMEDDVPPMPTTAQMAARRPTAEEMFQATPEPPEAARARRMDEAAQWAQGNDYVGDALPILREAARRNVSPEEIAAAPDFIRKPTLTRDDYTKISNRYPTVSTLLADPWMMAAFGNRDDINRFGQIEKEMWAFERTRKRMGEVWDYKMLQEQYDYLGGLIGTYGALAPDSVQAWAAERADIAASMEQMGGAKTIPLPEEKRREVNARFDWLEQISQAPAYGMTNFDTSPTSRYLAESNADLAHSLAEGGVEEFAAKALEVGAGMIDSMTRKETVALTGGYAVAGSAAGGIGAIPAAAVGFTSGVAYVNYLKGVGRGRDAAAEMGLTGPAADLVAAGYGMVNSVVDTLQTGIAVAPMKESAKKEFSQKIIGAALEFFKRAAEETGTEVLQDQLEMAADDMGAWYSNTFNGTDVDLHTLDERLGQALETVKFMVGGGALVGGAGPVGHLSGEAIRGASAKVFQWLGKKAEAAVARNANREAESLAKKTAAAVEASENMKAAPEAAGAMIERLAQEQGGPESVFVEAEALEGFRQSAFEREDLDAEAFEDTFLTPMGITTEQYQEAVDLGTSLELPLSAIPAVADTSIWKSIEQSEGLITAEPKNLTREKIEAAEALDGDPFAGIELQPDVTPETRRSVEMQLIAAGTERGPARVAAEIATRGISRILSPVVKDPNAWFKNHFQVVKGREGQSAGGRALHQAAMYRSQAATVGDFVREAGQIDPQGSKPYFRFDNTFGDTTIEIGTDQAKHITEGHPDFTEWERIPEVIERGRTIPAGPNRATGTDAVIYTLEDNGSTLVVVGAPNVGGRRREPRTMILTAFRDSTEGVKNWLANNKAASSPSVRLSHPDPGSRDVSPSGPQSGNLNISKIEQEVNALKKKTDSFKQAADGKPPRGMLQPLSDGGFLMTLFEGVADASTPIHESAHMFLETMRQVMATPLEEVADVDAFHKLKADFESLADFAGQTDPYGQWSTEAHEKVARAFEAYLMEGRAPVEGLRGVFEKMKTWLVDIYRSMRHLDVELTDEVRDVFDRLLAADDEIAFEGIRLAELEGLAPEVAAELSGPRTEAQTAQAEAIKKTRLAEANKLKAMWRKEAEHEANNHPHQRMMDEIIQNGGISAESLDAGGYTADHIKALNRKRPGLVKTESRVGFDEFAQKFGMDSDDFVNALIEGPAKKDIKAKYMAEQETANAEALAVDAPITDEEIKLRILEVEAERLKKVNSKTAAQVLRDTKKALDQPGGLTRYKSAILKKAGLRPVSEASALNMRDLKISLRAQAKGAREGGRAAARAKALEMTIQFQVKNQIRTERLKFEALAKKITHAQPGKYFETRGLAPEYHDQLLQLLGQFGIGPGAREGTPSLAAFVAEIRAEGRDEAVRVAEWIEKGLVPTWPNGKRAGTPKTWQGLDYNQFRDLYDAVENLRHLGRERQQMVAGGRRWNVENLARALDTNIRTNNDVAAPKSHKEIIEGKFEKKGAFKQFAEGVPGLNAALIKVETICRVLDGGQVDGLASQAIFAPVQKGWETATELTDLATKRLKEIVDATIGEKTLRKMRGEKVHIDGFPLMLVREQLVSLVLNSGNEGNLRSLMSIVINDQGDTLAMDHIEKARAALTDEEMVFVQQVWDFLDQEMYPRLNELEQRRSGVPLKKVEAQEFTTHHGTFRGGYYPLDFDQEISERAAANQERAANKDLMGGSYHHTSIKSAATNERVGTKYENLVPLLNFSVLSKSLNDNIHDLAYSEAVRDVQKIVQHPEVKGAIVGALGREYWNQIPLWIQEVAKPGSKDKIGLREVNNALRWIRNNLSLSTLGFKAAVAFCQVSGFSQSIQLLGTKHFLAGTLSHITNLRKSTDFMYGASLELKNRNKTSYDRDISDALGTRNYFYKTMKERFGEIAFAPIAITDQLLANCVWNGGYLRALEEGKTHEQAVYYADAIVRSTQPMGGVKDQSHVMRGAGYGDMGKLFTMYGTFFSGTHNLAWEQSRYSKRDWKAGEKGKAVGGAARAAVLLYVLPALFDQLIRGEVPEDEDDVKDWLSDLGKGVVSYSVAGIPVVKDLMSYLMGDTPRYQAAPIVGAIESTFGAVGGAWDIATDDGDYKDVRKVVRGVGVATGLPTGQAMVTMDGLEDWDDSESTIENLWHLLIRRPFEK